MVVFRVIEIDDKEALTNPLTLFIAESDLHALLYQFIILAVCGNQRLNGGNGDDLTDGFLISHGRKTGVQLLDSRPQGAGQHDLTIRCLTQQTVRPEIFVVVGVHRLPAKLLLQVPGGDLLDQGVFGIGDGCHFI